jgi:hypothetical protein
MMPDWLIVGAQRAGTTSLYRALSEHPAVVPAVRHKGVHYFDIRYDHSAAWYRGHFPIRALADARTRSWGSRARTGEASPYYMFHPDAPRRIAELLPDVRLIVSLRDPVERAYSAYTHEKARGFETESFERALELEPERLAGQVGQLRAERGYRSLAHQHQAYLTRGQYVEQLEEIYRHFAKEQVLVSFSERFSVNPADEYARLLDFLGLGQWTPPIFERANARARSSLDLTLRARLEEHFAPYDERLAALLGEVPPWRT